MHKPGNVLMVCLGNICRSPLAQGIFENMSKNFKIKVDSAGVANYHAGYPPDKRSINIAQKNGIDISMQKARQIRTKDFNDFDYIFVMDKENLHDVRKLFLNNNSEVIALPHQLPQSPPSIALIIYSNLPRSTNKQQTWPSSPRLP